MKPTNRVTLSDEQFQRIARAVAEPTRFEIMRRIYAQDAGAYCGAALEGLSISPGTASHHFNELAEAGLISGEREGRYRLLTARRETWQAYLRLLQDL